MSVPVFGQPLVLVRNAGRVWALEDRCPHRGVPLSAGCLTAKGLACPYHGWTFDGDGVCREMPGWPDASPTEVRIAAFDVIERDGLVWVSAKSSPLRSSALPDRITRLDASRQELLLQTVWHLRPPDAQERVLMAPSSRYATATYEVTGDGFSIDFADPDAGLGLLFGPGPLGVRAWFSKPGITQLEYRYARGAAIRVTVCFTPSDDDSTHVFALTHVEGRLGPRWLVRWKVSRLLRRIAVGDRTVPAKTGSVRGLVRASLDSSSATD